MRSHLLNDGNEGAVLARPSLQNSSRGGAYDQQHKHPLQDAETWMSTSWNFWTGHERVGNGQIRCDDLRRGDQCLRVSEETATYRQPHDGQTFRKIFRLLGSSRSEKLRLLPAVCHYFPELGKHGGHFLPRSHRALQEWKRRTQPRSRNPGVWCMWTVLILEFCGRSTGAWTFNCCGW